MSRRLVPYPAAGLLAVLLALAAPAARAGVVNPDISVIGQPFARWTDDPADPSRRRWGLDPGETEFVFDADLNPYARGTFVGSLGADGMSLEEGYFAMNRGLPLGLAIKGGKYRVGFGKLNPLHPHAYPFPDRFHVLAAYLPGEESFDETGVDVSRLFALPGDVALTASVDALQGNSFRIDRAPSGDPSDPLALDPVNGDRAAESRPAGLARLAAFVPLGDRSGLELGGSATRGTNDVAAATLTTVWGADAKAKLWRGANAYLLLQAEALGLDREVALWDAARARYTSTRVRPAGGYAFADWNWATRYDAGASIERWQEPDAARDWNQALGAFAGLALMEETTVFRIGFEHRTPARPAGAAADPDPVNTLTLRVVYSMGPHKAHQF